MTKSDAVHLFSILAQLGSVLSAVAKVELGLLARRMFSPGSLFSVYSLLSALAIAVVWVAAQRRMRGRRIRLKLIPRALFPPAIVRSASTKADAGFFLLSLFALGGLIGWALISYGAVAHWTEGALIAAFGHRPPSSLDPWLIRAFLAIAVFVAYEFGYWLDHYLSHTVPFLWEFHKVHHTAETLTPLTVFRVHPIDTLIFANIVAVLTGPVGGLGGFLAGRWMTSIPWAPT